MTKTESGALLMAAIGGDQKAISALKTGERGGDAWATEGLGVYYSIRAIAENNPKLAENAVTLFHSAALKQLPEAYLSLGNAYLNGQGTARDTLAAANAYKTAAELFSAALEKTTDAKSGEKNGECR